QVQVEFGLWWPASDPEGLLNLAAAWEAMAGAIDAAAEDLVDHRGAVTGANEGAAIDAFARLLGGWTGSHLLAAAEHCRELATACRDFAEAVEDARDTIRQLAIEIAASIAIGVGLAILTAGISTGAAATFTAGAVARAGIVATSLTARVIAIVSRVVTFAGVGALEAGATNLVIQTGRNAATNPNHDPFSGYNLEELTVSTVGGGLLDGAFGGIRSIPLIRGIEPAVPPPRPPPRMLDDLSAPQTMRLPVSQTWGRPNTLSRHFRDHGADFAARSADEYANMASDFFQRGVRSGLPTKIDPKTGIIRVYDPSSNTFGSFNPSGTTRTFFKPDPAHHEFASNWDYWLSQRGYSP
ncbi:MAG: hypothetical protein WD232_01495, partial [Acidimicrobiales bacterium]